MPLEFRKDDGRLVWVRSPFTGIITYFTHVHRKRSGFVRRQQDRALRVGTVDPQASEAQLRAELEAARRECPFCPGNERLTTAEILRVTPAQVPEAADRRAPWLIRGFTNLIPRIPECCTGDRNESYVLTEDPRHFADDATGHEDLLYTAALPAAQFEALVRCAVDVARRSYENPAVRAVLIRKNQGHDSGASQPHVHTQVIGSDLAFAPIQQEAAALQREPRLWHDIADFVRAERFLLEERDGVVSYFCPFGAFPRSYEVVALGHWARITTAPPELLRAFAQHLHGALRVLGPIPLDYEIHDGDGVPLHAHINSRHFPYSNIGGTLNLPSTLLDASPAAPPRRPARA